jgi:hypothetical protein
VEATPTGFLCRWVDWEEERVVRHRGGVVSWWVGAQQGMN